MIEIRLSVWDLVRRLITIVRSEITAWRALRAYYLRRKTKEEASRFASGIRAINTIEWQRRVRTAAERWMEGVRETADRYEAGVGWTRPYRKGE